MLIEVLIADNNIQLCAALTEFLNSQGDIEVVGCAYDGEEALEMIEKVSPDVVVLDITMPRLDGMAVLERLGELNLRKRPRIIVLTALARDDIAQRFTEMGADYYMLKPFDMHLLAERIRQFAESGARRPEPECSHCLRPARKRRISRRSSPTCCTKWACRPTSRGTSTSRSRSDDRHRARDRPASSLSKDIYPRLADKYNATPRGRGGRHSQRVDRLLGKGQPRVSGGAHRPLAAGARGTFPDQLHDHRQVGGSAAHGTAGQLVDDRSGRDAAQPSGRSVDIAVAAGVSRQQAQSPLDPDHFHRGAEQGCPPVPLVRGPFELFRGHRLHVVLKVGDVAPPCCRLSFEPVKAC